MSTASAQHLIADHHFDGKDLGVIRTFRPNCAVARGQAIDRLCEFLNAALRILVFGLDRAPWSARLDEREHQVSHAGQALIEVHRAD